LKHTHENNCFERTTRHNVNKWGESYKFLSTLYILQNYYTVLKTTNTVLQKFWIVRKTTNTVSTMWHTLHIHTGNTHVIPTEFKYKIYTRYNFNTIYVIMYLYIAHTGARTLHG
jgi:hypothetical protein